MSVSRAPALKVLFGSLSAASRTWAFQLSRRFCMRGTSYFDRWLVRAARYFALYFAFATITSKCLVRGGPPGAGGFRNDAPEQVIGSPDSGEGKFQPNAASTSLMSHCQPRTGS